MTALKDRIVDLIRHDGPMRLDTFMGLANAHYYGTRDPLGTAGDFITAPEISQLFGELIGLCLVDHWERAGAPSPIRLVELGPGRGTLMADLLRAARIRPAFLAAAEITLVETSPSLRARQAETLSAHKIDWAGTFAEIPDDAPLYLVANEFFDALPVRQFVSLNGNWHERLVTLSGDTLTLATAPSPLLAPHAGGDRLAAGRAEGGKSLPIPDGLVLETNPSAQAIAAEIGARLSAHGGLALLIDYGHASTAPGDTLQAMKSHAYADPLAEPGEADLTAHVDFEALGRAASAVSHGPVTQGDFLAGLGIRQRAAALARTRPDQAETLAQATIRLTSPDQMGTLFKVLALTGPHSPIPAGFGA